MWRHRVNLSLFFFFLHLYLPKVILCDCHWIIDILIFNKGKKCVIRHKRSSKIKRRKRQVLSLFLNQLSVWILPVRNTQWRQTHTLISDMMTGGGGRFGFSLLTTGSCCDVTRSLMVTESWPPMAGSPMFIRSFNPWKL